MQINNKSVNPEICDVFTVQDQIWFYKGKI